MALKEKRPQYLFADRLPPLIGGVEMHAAAFIHYFKEHPLYPIRTIIQKSSEVPLANEETAIFFFNSGRWIEEMKRIRKQYPLVHIVYRTGGNEIVKAPLNRSLHSHLERQSIWVQILNETVDLMITNSEYTENRLRSLGLKVPFVRCVGGVDTITPKPISEQDPKVLRFFSAARFVPYKNHDLLIRVFNELHQKGKKFSLSLAGDGPLLHQAQKAAEGNHQIQFLGRCDNAEVLKHMTNADVYIQFSSDCKIEVPGGSYIHSEGMGRSILEAISLGTYVIAGKCGALSEIVHSNRGKLLSLKSFDDIVQSIEEVFESPPKRNALTDEFNWNCLFKQYEHLYESLNHH